MTPLPTIPARKIDAIEAIYAELPALKCKGLCQECCGPVAMSRLEWQRIVRRLGKEPRPTDEQIANLRCPLLTEQGRCSVYHIRPLICRLWGLVKAMACPHGCEPERWLTDAESYRLLARMEKAGR